MTPASKQLIFTFAGKPSNIWQMQFNPSKCEFIAIDQWITDRDQPIMPA